MLDLIIRKLRKGKLEKVVNGNFLVYVSLLFTQNCASLRLKSV